MRWLYIIVREAGDRTCHYWISTASLSLHMTQSATNACGQRDGGSGETKITEQRRIGGTKAVRERYVVAEMKGKRQGEGS